MRSYCTKKGNQKKTGQLSHELGPNIPKYQTGSFFNGLNKTILGYFGLPMLYMVPHEDWSRQKKGGWRVVWIPVWREIGSQKNTYIYIYIYIYIYGRGMGHQETGKVQVCPNQQKHDSNPFVLPRGFGALEILNMKINPVKPWVQVRQNDSFQCSQWKNFRFVFWKHIISESSFQDSASCLVAVYLPFEGGWISLLIFLLVEWWKKSCGKLYHRVYYMFIAGGLRSLLR